MLNNLLKIVSFYLCFLGTQNGFGQTIDVKTQDFNETNGLSTYANFIHKDSRDIIWIGTQFGLYRFDGQEFAHFDEKDGLPFRQIMEIFEDTEGWFWLHKTCINKPNCIPDLAFFHPLTNQVLTFEERFGDRGSIQTHEIRGIAKDSAKIYFTAGKKLLIWSKEGSIREKTIKGIENPLILWTKINEDLLGAIEFDPLYPRQYFTKDIQYLAVDTTGSIRQQFQLPPHIHAVGVNRFRTNHFEFEKFRVANLEIEKAPNGILTTDTLDFFLPCCPKSGEYIDFDKNLMVDEQGRLFHSDIGFLKKQEKVYSTGLNLSDGLSILSGKIWIKEKGSPNYFQQFNGGFRHYYFDHETKTGWLALSNGIKTFEYKTQRIKHLKPLNQEKQLSRSAYPISKLELLLCIHLDWFIYHTQTNELKSFSTLSDEEYNTQRGSIGYKAVDTGDLWFFNQSLKFRNFRLLKLNTQNLELIESSPVIQKTDFGPRQMIQLGNRFLVGENKGLTWYHIDNHTLEPYHQYNEFEGLKTAKVHFFKKHDEEYFWIGSNAGLYWFSKEKGVLARYGDTEEGDFYIPAKDFYHMSEAKSGGYWLATMQGLVQLAVDSSQLAVGEIKIKDYRLFDSNSGLSTNELLAAFEDNYGFVWMPTPHGLIQMQISTGLSKTYREGDGLSSKSFQEYAHAQMPDGTLILGSYKGFNVLHPKDFKDVQFNPEVSLAILDFEQYKANTNQIEYRLKEVIEKGEITLESGDKFFNIRVALSDYRNADKHRFAYKIEGYQTDWQEDKSNLIRISGLPYGNYTLKIKGRLPDGQFSGSVLELPIRVLRPFYLKAEFFAFAFLVLAAGIFWFFRWRTRQYQIRQKELEIEIGKATQTIQKQNEELKNLDKLKSRFFANISHELRTPLTLILGPIAAALKENKLTNKTYTNLLIAKRNGERLHKMIDEILDLTKLEANKLELKPSPVEWYPFLQIVLHQFESLAGARQIQLKFEYDLSENLTIEIDKRKTEIILYNLLSNAFKFTNEKGEITVKTQQSGKFLQIVVSDTGAGIHPEDLPHIFNRFYQTQQQDAEAQGGTGIGLALTREFVHLMGGTISVESELQKGSVFTVKIPKTEVISANSQQSNGIKSITPETIKSETPAVVPLTSNDKPVILLVEDNLDLSNFIKSLLTEEYQVITAENGQAALELLCAPPTPKGELPPAVSQKQDSKSVGRSSPIGAGGAQGRPDLIISDVMMPVMDGFKLLKHLKTSGEFRHIPVIMLTARTELRDKLKALRIGVDDYLTKPFAEEELFARIQNLLKNAENRMATPPETDAESPKPPVPTIDTEWLEKLESVTLSQIDNVNLVIDHIAREMELSERQFYRRVKENTGQTPNQYIKTIRLTAARKLLEDRTHNSVKSVALSVGFKDIKYFSLQFKKAFGRLPSEYL